LAFASSQSLLACMYSRFAIICLFDKLVTFIAMVEYLLLNI